MTRARYCPERFLLDLSLFLSPSALSGIENVLECMPSGLLHVYTEAVLCKVSFCFPYFMAHVTRKLRTNDKRRKGNEMLQAMAPGDACLLVHYRDL